MGEEPISGKTISTTWATNDYLIKLDESETNKREKVKKIAPQNILVGNEAGDVTIGNKAHSGKLNVTLEDAGGTPQTLIIGDPDIPTIEIEKFLTLSRDSATISGGVITATSSYMRIDTEGAAASDDLDTISGVTKSGTILILQANNDARTVVVKHGTDNILNSGAADISLDHSADKILLIYDGSNTKWIGMLFANVA
jgi:hypothetical protein